MAMVTFFYIEHPSDGHYYSVNDEWVRNMDDDVLYFTSYEYALDKAAEVGGLAMKTQLHR
jgi:hypothetical protein